MALPWTPLLQGSGQSPGVALLFEVSRTVVLGMQLGRLVGMMGGENLVAMRGMGVMRGDLGLFDLVLLSGPAMVVRRTVVVGGGDFVMLGDPFGDRVGVPHGGASPNANRSVATTVAYERRIAEAADGR